jgi:hypothetical protein
MKSRFVTTACLLGTLVATPVFAQEDPAAPPAASVTEAAKPAPRFTVGAQLELMPTGSFDISLSGPTGNADASFDTTTAFGVSGVFAYDVTRNLSIGVAPRLIMGVNFTVPDATDTGDDAKQFDLRARIAVHGEIAPKLQIYGYAAPGYSWLIPPDDDNDSGFSIGGGAGASYDVTDAFYVNAELGYQIAYYSDENAGLHADVDVSYLHLGLGGGARF